MHNPFEVFTNKIAVFQIKENELKAQIDKWSLFRGLLFVLTIGITYVFAVNLGNIYAVSVFLIGFTGFLLVVSRHLNLVTDLKQTQILKEINQKEINRLENNFEGISDGFIFQEKNHDFATDLDLLGPHSLYQLVNRSHTFEGNKLFSQWLKVPASKHEVLERQVASAEIENDIDFRQNIEMQALIAEKINQPITKLLDWLALPPNTTIQKPLFKIARFLPFITILVLIGAALGYYTFYFVGLLYLIHGSILKTIEKQVGEALEQTELASDVLKPYVKIIELINQKQFNSPKLLSLKSNIFEANLAIAALQKIVHQLSYRSNPAFALTGGILLLWDLKYFNKLEAWKSANNTNMAVWVATVSEFEALNSLASFKFANPNYAQPSISENDFELKTKAIGHPLIVANKRKYNDFEIPKLGHTVVLTGSNMSGKSTFERTLGQNLVLAQMGAVVCAKLFLFVPLQMFTSMRTQDSLENDTSSFYAELKRLERLIKIAKQKNTEKPVFYLLDEVLKGTNSKDRHSGAKALILQLCMFNTAGVISTHDVELGDEFEGQSCVTNYSFSSEMIDNELVFDYQLKEGVCHSFNASELMRRIGLNFDG